MTTESPEPYIVWVNTDPETITVVQACSSTEASDQVSRLGNERVGRTIITAEAHYSPILTLILAYPKLKKKYSHMSIVVNELEIWEACYPGKSLQEEAQKILMNNQKLINENPGILSQLGMPGMILEAQEFLVLCVDS
jgi:hypothetical protein